MEKSIKSELGYIQKAVDFRKGVFEKISAKDADRVWLKAAFKDIRKVLIIAAASRSGSSLLFTILKRLPSIYSLSGESVPFYKLNGLSFGPFHSDEIARETIVDPKQRLNLSCDFLSDFSLAAQEDRSRDAADSYIDDLALRFSLQWPGVDFSYEVFARLARQAYETYARKHKLFCVDEFYLELILSLRQEYKIINPYYYDIPVLEIKKKFPFLEMPSGPPHDTLTIEEPPFILLSPRKKATKEDLFDKTLLLKSSVDCYRMPFLETLFPDAQIKVIYLTRNPFGSINGLYDGWLYRGFFSHNLSEALKENKQTLGISGYSDSCDWGRWWWKYDLPPGWQGYTEKRLEEVCAFQWYCANNKVRDYLKESKRDYCHIKYENIIGSLSSRTTEINKIISFIGLDDACVGHLHLNKLPVVQATEEPGPCRWKKREGVLLPFLDDPKISETSASLGYCKNNTEEWF